MNRERICEAGEHRITCPDRFGRIYIRLVASLVGLDARLELDGNDDIVCSSFNLSPKRAKESNSNGKGKGKGSSKTKSKSKPFTTGKSDDKSDAVPAGSTRSKHKSQKEEAEKKILRNLVKDVDDHRMRTSRKDPAKTSTGRRPLPTKRDECVDLCEEEGDSAPNAGTSTVSPSPLPTSRTTSTPHYTYQQQSSGKSTGKRGANAMAASSAAQGDGRVGESGGNKFMNWREQKRRREEAAAGGGRNLAPNTHNIRGPSGGSGPSIGSNSGAIAAAAVNKGSNSSWRYERKEQTAMQKRAFGSPKENPFSSFQFDPNCAESNLDALSDSRSSSIASMDNGTTRDRNNGFIPPSFGLTVAAGGRMAGRRFSTAKKKSRPRANGLTLSPTELLRNKANEMAALQGQMQYQVTATSTGMGMPTGPGPGPHSEYESLGQ